MPSDRYTDNYDDGDTYEVYENPSGVEFKTWRSPDPADPSRHFAESAGYMAYNNTVAATTIREDGVKVRTIARATSAGQPRPDGNNVDGGSA